MENEMSQNGSDRDPWSKPGQSNDQQTGNSSNNGWNNNQNRGNQEQSPPDIEEIFNNLLKKLGGGNKRAVKIMAVLKAIRHFILAKLFHLL